MRNFPRRARVGNCRGSAMKLPLKACAMQRRRRSWHRSSLALLLTALVAGCTSYDPKPLSPADEAAAIDARTLEDPRLLKFISLERASMPTTKRWDLADLTLAALYYHP